MKSRVEPSKNRFLFFLMLLVFPSVFFLHAQTISPQKLGFVKICAGGNGFNTFKVAFKIQGFDASTTFEVILSDNLGSWTNPVSTTLVPNDPSTTPPDTSTDKTLTFAVPTTLIGSEIYHLKVKSVNGVVSSSNGVVSGDFMNWDGVYAFPGYYKTQDAQFTINNSQEFASFCTGGSVVLTIDNPGGATNDSPLKYPSLTYNWFEDSSITPIASTASLTVSQPGIYHVETNYGSCNPSLSYSNKVTVSAGTSGSVATLSSSLGNPFCAGQGETTLSTQTGNSYVWKKDNVVITGVNTNTYNTNQAGVYTVDVDYGGCVSSSSIDLKVEQFISTIDASSFNSIQEGELKTVTVTTDAISPSYAWYLDNAVIPNESGSSYNVTVKGNYKVAITQNSGCINTNEIPFIFQKINIDPNAVKIPNLISPNGDGTNDTWVIPQEYTVGTNTEVQIINSYGEEVLKTNDYLNNWPENQIDFKNVNPVYYYIITTQDQQVKKGSITVVK